MTKKFAKVAWRIEDIKSLRPDWSDEQCREFLSDNQTNIIDEMVQSGWFYIEQTLGEIR